MSIGHPSLAGISSMCGRQKKGTNSALPFFAGKSYTRPICENPYSQCSPDIAAGHMVVLFLAMMY